MAACTACTAACTFNYNVDLIFDLKQWLITCFHSQYLMEKDKRMENVNRQVLVNVIMYVVTRNKLVGWSRVEVRIVIGGNMKY